MKNNKFIIVILICILLLPACLVLKPDSNSVSDLDYNQRAEIEGAYFRKKVSLTGYGIVAVSTITTGLILSSSPIIAQQNGSETVMPKLANFAVGAFLGYSFANLGNVIAGKNTSVNPQNPNEWLKKTNEEFILLSKTSNSDFEVIHKSAESSYVVKNYQDVKDFATAFPNSTYIDDVINQILTCSAITREQYLEFIGLFPTSTLVTDLKKQYVLKSTSVADLFAAYDKFPETKIDIETLAVTLVTDCDDAILYAKRFPTSANAKKVFLNSLQSSCSAYNSKLMKTAFSSVYKLSATDLTAKTNTEKENYLNFLKNLETFSNALQITEFYKKNYWIEYPDRNADILEDVWTKNYSILTDGNLLVGQIYGLPTDYPLLKITTSQVNTFIKTKLTEEVTNNVKKVSVDIIDNQDETWEKWKNSGSIWDAPFIEAEGEIKYLVYGSIKNSSKFDLPVKLEISAPLNQSTTTRILGGFLGSETTSKELGTKTESFYIKTLESGKTYPFAVILDFGVGTKAEGSYMVVVTSFSELQIGTPTLNSYYNTTTVTSAITTKQEEWLELSTTGGFTAKTYVNDVLNNEQYDPVSYEESWEQFKTDLVTSDGGGSYSSYDRDDYDDSNTENVEEETEEYNADIIECIEDLQDDLEVDASQDENLINWDCPCTIYGDSSIGSLLTFKVNSKGEWYYSDGILASSKGPFYSEYEALKAYCIDNY